MEDNQPKTIVATHENGVADLLLFCGAILAGIFTLPLPPFAPMDDDWDFLIDLLNLPFLGAVLAPTNGHFFPLHKLVYGSLLVFFNFDFWPAAIVQAFVRLTTLGVLRLALRTAGAWSFRSAVLLLCLVFSEVGVRAIFRWPMELSLELALLCTISAIYCLMLFDKGRPEMLAVACGAAFLGALAKEQGLCAALALPVAVLFMAGLRREALPRRAFIALVLVASAVLILWWLGAQGAIGGAGALTREAEWWAASTSPGGSLMVKFQQTALYFFYMTFANSALAGFKIGLFPGALTATFAFLILGGAVLVVRRSPDRSRALLAACLLFTHLAVNAATAATRWPYGLAHAGSYRYVYLNVFFQTLLLLLLLGDLRVASRPAPRLPRRLFDGTLVVVCLAVMAITIPGGFRGLTVTKQAEHERWKCLNRPAQAAPQTPCVDFGGYQSESSVRDTWRRIGNLEPEKARP